MKKLLLTLVLSSAVVMPTRAQFNEYFEDETVGTTTFLSDGQSFTLTNGMKIGTFAGFGVDAAYPASVSGTSSKFTEVTGLTKTVSIKTADAKEINILELYFYVTSNPTGDIAPVNGSISLIGKLAGVTKYTITKASPGFAFPSVYNPYNGFSKIDLGTEGTAASTNIDELTISYSGNIVFFNIDNFRWKVATLGANEFKRDLFAVYPNPTSNQVKIMMNDGSAFEGNYVLRDVNGKNLQTGKVQDADNVISLSSYAKGIYLLEVETKQGKSVQKLIKK